MAKYNVTIEKTLRIGIEVEADDENEINVQDYFGILTNEDSSVEYDWSICDEDFNTLIDWKL
jgi:hypothetical protein